MKIYVTLRCTGPPSIAQLEAFQAKVSDISDMFPTREIVGLLIYSNRQIANLAVNWLNAYNTVFYAIYKYSKNLPQSGMKYSVVHKKEKHPNFIRTIREAIRPPHVYSYRVKSRNECAYNKVTRRRRKQHKERELR